MHLKSTDFVFFIVIAGLGLFSCQHYPTEFCTYSTVANDTIPLVTKIAFGSCAKEDKNQPILKVIANKQPDLFIYLGDNIYGNTEDMVELKGKYALLSCKEEFQYLMGSNPVIATWDDHDYGANDIGEEYPKKEESKQLFLEFWKEPPASPRWSHPGIYTSYYYGDSTQRVQIILLDMRTFRSSLTTSGADFVPDPNPSKTFLGAEQWLWLENELAQPATIRFICSSTPFGSEASGDETWSNFPVEQQKMYDLLQSTQANGIVFLSGDVHYAELSKRIIPGLYPIYDFTSSGLTQVDPIADGNQYRVGTAYTDRNFGMIEINWSIADPEIKFIIYNEIGQEVYLQTTTLATLHF